jgi:hypothetical protein
MGGPAVVLTMLTQNSPEISMGNDPRVQRHRLSRAAQRSRERGAAYFCLLPWVSDDPCE